MSYVTGIGMWVSVQEPNTTFDPAWKLDLVVDPETAKILQDQGLNVKPSSSSKGAEEFGAFVVSFKQPVTSNKTGETNAAPIVIDSDAQPFTSLIGNGSLIKVEYKASRWKFAGKSGITGYLRG